MTTMGERRRDHIRLEVSRAATDLFWHHGVAATSGEQIAAAVGMSVRTLWRHFRNKESCAEPIMLQNIEERLALLRRWSRVSSLEAHIATELRRRSEQHDPRRSADDLLSIRMVGLADREPDIRAAWLMATDRVERQLVEIFAARLDRREDDHDVRRFAAVSAAAMRVLDEDVSRTLLADKSRRVDAAELSRRIARAVREATGGALGDAVDPVPPRGRRPTRGGAA